MMTLVVFSMKINGVTRKRSVWNYEQESGFMEKQLLVSYSTNVQATKILKLLSSFTNKHKNSTKREQNVDRWNEKEGEDIGFDLILWCGFYQNNNILL